jgi:iron complex outermembrane receptor protein
MSSRFNKHKNALLISSALCLVAGAALAQEGETVIVTGTRVVGMTAADSAAPITVLGADALANGVGSPDVRQAISQLVPSFTAQQTGGDTAELSLSAALRGLSPNDTLVLVNGVRRHYSANLHVDGGSFASGSASADLSLIPESAIDHIEVLQDGAAAQYGTDAIGGVVNIILKKNSKGGVVTGMAGQYYDSMGETFDASGNVGLPLTDNGFISLTGEYQTKGFTFNGGPDPRLINASGAAVPVGTVGTTPNAAGVITCSAGNCIPTTGPYAVSSMKYYPYVNRIAGNGEYTSAMGTFNAGYDLTPDFHLYAFGSVAQRVSRAFENVRLPTQNIATPGSNQPCSATNPQGYNTAQTASGGVACAIGVSNTGSASGAGVAILAGSAAATPGVNSKGTIISSGQAGTLFTSGELVQYPNGMEPQEGIRELDYQYTGGAKFTFATIDFNAAVGYSKDFDKVYTYGSGNRSLFIDTHVSPKDFYDGAFQSSQFIGTLDAEKTFAVGLASPLTVAAGVEAREDTYAIYAGDPASYYKEGAQSFPGFAPTTAGIHSRKNYAGYLDFSVAPVEELTIDIAGRFEHFTDFGDAKIGKITARYDFSPVIAVRGTISTGFRAPTLAEEYYTAVNVSPTSATVQLPANSAAAKILGLQNLAPEISSQFSAGVVLHPFSDLSATIDAYSTTVGNRIVASSTINSSGGAINTPLVTQAIIADGVSLDPTATSQGATAYFNGLSTLTKGIDVMVQYYTDFAEYGVVNWILSGNYNDTSISKVAPPPAVLVASNPSATFFTFQSLYNFRHSTPTTKIGASADWTLGDFGVTLRETYYGPQHSYTSPNSGGELVPWNQPAVGLTDLELRYTVPDTGLQISLGGNNLFGIRAKGVPFAPASCTGGGVIIISGSCALGPNNANGQAVNANNGSVIGAPFSSAFNPNGGFYYLRAAYKF